MFNLLLILILLPFAPLRVLAEESIVLPKPGTMVTLSPAFNPAVMKGMVIDVKDPFKFDFIIDHGDASFSTVDKKQEYSKLIKYFLAALAVPDDQQWVNLSPYEKDHIIPETFGQTQMGHDLLAQDYILKQISSSLFYPDSETGKKYWSTLYSELKKRNALESAKQPGVPFRDGQGLPNVPMKTFSKVWIVPDHAVVYQKNNVVYIVENHLKVMTEDDYISTKKHAAGETESVSFARSVRGSIASSPATPRGDGESEDKRNSSGAGPAHASLEMMRKIMIPVLEKEVNEGKNFALLRQVYSGMLLATWYKRNLKATLLSKRYANQGNIDPVDTNLKQNQHIYEQYVQAFKKGVFNMIKDEPTTSGQLIPRKYFAGGTKGYDQAQISTVSGGKLGSGFKGIAKQTDIVSAKLRLPSISQAQGKPVQDLAMWSGEEILKDIGLQRGGILELSAYFARYGYKLKKRNRDLTHNERSRTNFYFLNPDGTLTKYDPDPKLNMTLPNRQTHVFYEPKSIVSGTPQLEGYLKNVVLAIPKTKPSIDDIVNFLRILKNNFGDVDGFLSYLKDKGFILTPYITILAPNQKVPHFEINDKGEVIVNAREFKDLHDPFFFLVSLPNRDERYLEQDLLFPEGTDVDDMIFSFSKKDFDISLQPTPGFWSMRGSRANLEKFGSESLVGWMEYLRTKGYSFGRPESSYQPKKGDIVYEIEPDGTLTIKEGVEISLLMILDPNGVFYRAHSDRGHLHDGYLSRVYFMAHEETTLELIAELLDHVMYRNNYSEFYAFLKRNGLHLNPHVTVKDTDTVVEMSTINNSVFLTQKQNLFSNQHHFYRLEPDSGSSPHALIRKLFRLPNDAPVILAIDVDEDILNFGSGSEISFTDAGIELLGLRRYLANQGYAFQECALGDLSLPDIHPLEVWIDGHIRKAANMSSFPSGTRYFRTVETEAHFQKSNLLTKLVLVVPKVDKYNGIADFIYHSGLLYWKDIIAMREELKRYGLELIPFPSNKITEDQLLIHIKENRRIHQVNVSLSQYLTFVNRIATEKVYQLVSDGTDPVFQAFFDRGNPIYVAIQKGPFDFAQIADKSSPAIEKKLTVFDKVRLVKRGAPPGGFKLRALLADRADRPRTSSQKPDVRIPDIVQKPSKVINRKTVVNFAHGPQMVDAIEVLRVVDLLKYELEVKARKIIKERNKGQIEHGQAIARQRKDIEMKSVDEEALAIANGLIAAQDKIAGIELSSARTTFELTINEKYVEDAIDWLENFELKLYRKLFIQEIRSNLWKNMRNDDQDGRSWSLLMDGFPYDEQLRPALWRMLSEYVMPKLPKDAPREARSVFKFHDHRLETTTNLGNVFLDLEVKAQKFNTPGISIERVEIQLNSDLEFFVNKLKKFTDSDAKYNDTIRIISVLVERLRKGIQVVALNDFQTGIILSTSSDNDINGNIIEKEHYDQSEHTMKWEDFIQKMIRGGLVNNVRANWIELNRSIDEQDVKKVFGEKEYQLYWKMIRPFVIDNVDPEIVSQIADIVAPMLGFKALDVTNHIDDETEDDVYTRVVSISVPFTVDKIRLQRYLIRVLLNLDVAIQRLKKGSNQLKGKDVFELMGDLKGMVPRGIAEKILKGFIDEEYNPYVSVFFKEALHSQEKSMVQAKDVLFRSPDPDHVPEEIQELCKLNEATIMEKFKPESIQVFMKYFVIMLRNAYPDGSLKDPLLVGTPEKAPFENSDLLKDSGMVAEGLFGASSMVMDPIAKLSKGGIDLNPKTLDLTVRGDVVSDSIVQQTQDKSLNDMVVIHGLVPVILDIKPIAQSPIFQQLSGG